MGKPVKFFFTSFRYGICMDKKSHPVERYVFRSQVF
jgi:hypothetical protein